MTTAYSDRALPSQTDFKALGRIFGRRRHVQVSVLVEGREQDAFQCSSAATLQAAVRPVYKHLPGNGATVRFVGVEEAGLRLGWSGSRRKAELGDLRAALAYLADGVE